MDRLVNMMPLWFWNIVIILLAVLVAFLLHRIFLRIINHIVRKTITDIDDILITRLHRPVFWFLIAATLSVALASISLTDFWLTLWERVAGLAFPAIIGWLAIALLGAAIDIVKARADMSVADNLRARRRQTRANILHRIGVFLILLATFCMMLMSIPSVRSVGVTLIASAGLAALAVGAAAQPALKNLIAGLQMAFTEPIRIDDVVIVDNEWGRIEDIRLTYVVIKLWDERRLIVPVSKFLEESFQNWTRQTSDILGSVFWYLDPAADIARIREKFGELIEAHPLWDRRFYNLMVTDTKPEAIEVRALMTARDASTAFDLRCAMREAILVFIRQEMPESFVRNRSDIRFHQNEDPAER